LELLSNDALSQFTNTVAAATRLEISKKNPSIAFSTSCSRRRRHVADVVPDAVRVGLLDDEIVAAVTRYDWLKIFTAEG